MFIIKSACIGKGKDDTFKVEQNRHTSSEYNRQGVSGVFSIIFVCCYLYFSILCNCRCL